jgi:uncharacterized membrane protein
MKHHTLIIIILLTLVVIILTVPYFTDTTIFCERTEKLVLTTYDPNIRSGDLEQHYVYKTEISCREER